MANTRTRQPVQETRAALLEAALAYAARQWRVFPCHTPVPSRPSGCSCSKADCTDQGKHPRTLHGCLDATTDPAAIRRWWKTFPDANIGIATGTASNLAVLDVDSYKHGDISLQELEDAYHPLPETAVQLTGGGGLQYLFAHPGTPVPNRVEKLGDGLDVRGDGGYIIAPPSLHLSGKRYAWELSSHPDETPLAPFPAWLLALSQPSPRAPSVDMAAPILEGARNDTLFRAGCAMRARGFASPAIVAALHAMNAAQCHPALPDTDVERIAAQCTRYSPGTLGAISPGSQGGTLADHAHEPWRDQLIVNKKSGDPTCNVSNIGVILANHAYWHGKFWWDSVRATPMYEVSPLTKETITIIGQWFGTHMRLPMSNLRPLEECLIVQCQKEQRDLLHIFVNTLPRWDGTPRLSDWLTTVAGCDPNPYTQAVGRVWFLSMIARALQPGCRYRFMIILEGPEEAGKSDLVKAVASPDWYAEISMALESKESHMAIQGVWLAEMAELDSMSRTEETRLKAFITLTEDRWIPKYSNFPISNPRRAIFIGTTNERSYLKGQTGNTRFLPLPVGTIDLERLYPIRLQLFAEALAIYRGAPETFWQLSEEALARAVDAREERRIENVYEDSLCAWLGQMNKTETTWEEIALHFLRLEAREKWKDMILQKQIASALRHLGWEQKVIWRDGKTLRIWDKQA